jgi:hypothetical protein
MLSSLPSSHTTRRAVPYPAAPLNPALFRIPARLKAPGLLFEFPTLAFKPRPSCKDPSQTRRETSTRGCL